MKKYCGYILVFGMFCVASFGCESSKFCEENLDCINMCRAYDGNDVLYACEDGQCSCVSKEALACTGDEETDKCAGVCARYRPDSMSACVDGICECQTKECNDPADCQTICNGAAMFTCNAHRCMCLEAEKLACSGEQALAHCTEICDTYQPGSQGSCVNSQCSCKTNRCESDAECEEPCSLYQSAMSACVDAKCQCIGKEALACSGADATERCTKICAKYKPGTLAVCEQGMCTCSKL